MRKIFIIAMFAMMATLGSSQQVVYRPSIRIVTTAPSGSCQGGLPNEQLLATGLQYSCQNVVGGVGTWGVQSGGQINYVNCANYGVVCNGSTDASPAINACLAAAKGQSLIGMATTAVLPAGNCVVSSESLNMTNTTTYAGGIWLRGGGMGVPTSSGDSNGTTLVDKLVPATAVIDAGGDNQGGIEDLTISTPDQTHAGTNSTSGILIDPGNSGSNQGGGFFLVRDVGIWGSGEVAGGAGLVILGSDQVKLDNVRVMGGGIVAGWGLGRSTSVASSYYTLANPGYNTTYLDFENVDSCGNYEPAYQFTGSADYIGNADYGCLIGAGSAVNIVEFNSEASYSGTAANQVNFNGFRTENQSSATGVCAIMIGTRVTGGTFSGLITTDSSGPSICTEGTNSTAVYKTKFVGLSAGGNPTFNVGTGWIFSEDKFVLAEGAPSTLGTINSGSTWMNDSLLTASNQGGSLPSSFLNQFPAGSSVCVYSATNDWVCGGNPQFSGYLTAANLIASNFFQMGTPTASGNVYAQFENSTVGYNGLVISQNGNQIEIGTNGLTSQDMYIGAAAVGGTGPILYLTPSYAWLKNGEWQYSIESPAVASASTISPTAPYLHISGTAAIATITVPSFCSTAAEISCVVHLIPDGAFTTTTGGNIAIASTAIVSRVLTETYDPGNGKWYPSY